MRRKRVGADSTRGKTPPRFVQHPLIPELAAYTGNHPPVEKMNADDPGNVIPAYVSANVPNEYQTVEHEDHVHDRLQAGGFVHKRPRRTKAGTASAITLLDQEARKVLPSSNGIEQVDGNSVPSLKGLFQRPGCRDMPATGSQIQNQNVFTHRLAYYQMANRK